MSPPFRYGGRGRGRGSPSDSTNPMTPPSSSSPTAARTFPQLTIAELIANPARQSMPRLHPDRIPGTMWFARDAQVNASITSAYQAYFPGPYRNLSMVPVEVVDRWWSSFVQNYYWTVEHHAAVQKTWKSQLQDLLKNVISKAKRVGNKPRFVSDQSWNQMQDHWNSEEGLRRSRSAKRSRLSDRDGKGPHVHTAGRKSFFRVRDEMVAKNPNTTLVDVVRKTHTSSDGTFQDKRTEELLQTAEIRALELASSSQESGATSTPQDLDRAFLEVNVPHNGRRYGMGGIYTHEQIIASTINPVPPPPVPEVAPRVAEELSEFRRSLTQLTDGFNRMSEQVAEMYMTQRSTQYRPEHASTSQTPGSGRQENPSTRPHLNLADWSPHHVDDPVWDNEHQQPHQ